MAEGNHRGGSGRPKRDAGAPRAARGAPAKRAGGAGRSEPRTGGKPRFDDRQPGAGRGDSGRKASRPERTARDGARPARPNDRSRTEGPEATDGFGPYAARSRDFDGGRRRRDEPGAAPKPRPRRAGGDDPGVRKVAREAVARGGAPRRPALRVVHGEAPDLGARPDRSKRARRGPAPRELGATVPAATGPRPPRLTDALQKATRAIERGYEHDALRILRPLRDRHPTDPDVREMNGVALYRAGKWAAAKKELEAFVELTGSATQHPLLMDCARALGRHTLVNRLWEELRAASPAPEIMTEGRIVAAGALADRGQIPEAIKLLERGPVAPKRVAEHHLRLWYALADLHERAGDIPTARALFRKVSAKDPAFVDVAERLAALS